MNTDFYDYVFICKIDYQFMSENELPKIRDIAKFKKMREIMEGFKLMNNILPLVNPFLGVFGVNTKEIRDAFTELDFGKLEKDFIELSEFPDKFNDVFSSRGWIVYDFLNLDTAKTALKIAETDINAAEKFLVDSYTFEEVKRYLYMMHGVKAFHSRMELAEKALFDYKEERYHACIPVVLALMDGLVNELSPQNLGMFAENSNLTAWDSITAHEKGLNTLKEVLFKTRKTTRTEEITIPYRHGILHGMDLGYANKTVAAKTWAALFSVRDWAVIAEGKLLFQPPPEPPATWTDLFSQIKEHDQWKQSFDEYFRSWKPRIIKVGKDIPQTGDATDFEDGTPERKVVEFLLKWRKRNYGHMADCIWSNFQLSGKQMAGRIRETYESYILKNFELIEIVDKAPSITEIKVLLFCENAGNSFEKETTFRLVINDSLDNKVVTRGMPNATWGITNWGYEV